MNQASCLSQNPIPLIVRQ